MRRVMVAAVLLLAPALLAAAAPPMNLTVAPGDGKLDVGWAEPADAPTGYDVHYTSSAAAADDAEASGSDPSAGWVDAGHVGTETRHALTGLTNGRAYRVRVRGVYAKGAGPWAARTGTPRPPFWSAEFTVAEFDGRDRGCRDGARAGADSTSPQKPDAFCSAALTEDAFAWEGAEYRITEVIARPLAIGLDRAIPRSMLSVLCLRLDGSAFCLRDCELSAVGMGGANGNLNQASWAGRGFAWTVGQRVSLSLFDDGGPFSNDGDPTPEDDGDPPPDDDGDVGPPPGDPPPGGPPGGGPPVGGPPGGGDPPPPRPEDDGDDDDDGSGGGSPSGGGGPPPAPPEDDGDDDDDGSGGGPPSAAIETDAVCEAGLCRARAGAAVSFRDASTGTVNSRLWDFDDGGQSQSAAPSRSWASPGFYEVTLTVGDGTVESTDSLIFLVEAAELAGTCVADVRTRCLRDSRFAVEMEWWTGEDGGGPGKVVPEGTNDSALFHFFEPGDNWEVLIKVLDGCSVNEHVWVYGASATTLGYRIRVTDTVTGVVREYMNEDGRRADAIADSEAFSGVCGGG